MSGRPAKYAYPAAVGEETRNSARDRRHAHKIMSLASDRGRRMNVVYRCRREGGEVVIRRAA